MDTDTIGIFLEHQGFSDESIGDFLEHFGVRGQKWGVRRQSRLDFKSAKLTAKAAHLVNRRNQLDQKSASISLRRDGGGSSKTKTVGKIIGVAGLASVAAGALYAKRYFGVKSNDIPIKTIGQYMSVVLTGLGITKTVMSMNGQQPYDQLKEKG